MMLKTKELFGRWRNSAAGKISVILFIVSIVLMILACSPWGNFSERVANNINNILFGLATNLLGIIVTVSFVQYFIDKQDARLEECEEKAQILRYDRLMSVLVQRYKMYFYCVVTPMDMRTQKDINALDKILILRICVICMNNRFIYVMGVRNHQLHFYTKQKIE